MLTVRHIATTTIQVAGPTGAPVPATVPKLDEHGHTIELWSVEVPREIEAEGGDAIDAYVKQILAERASAPVTLDTQET